MASRAGIDRAAVVRAAVALIDESGPQALTLAAVAATLGVRTPSLYNHVEGLAGLHRELALYGTRELGARLAHSAIGKAADEAVLALATAYRAFVRAHPGLYSLTVRASRTMQPVDPALLQAEEDVVVTALTVLAAYDLQGDDALHAVRALRSLVHGFATLEVAGGFGLPLDVDESFACLVRMFIDALHR